MILSLGGVGEIALPEGKTLALRSASIPSAAGREWGTTNRIGLGGKQGIFQLVWRQHLLDQVRSYVGETYVSRSGRGQDVGGVIFGQRLGELVQVVAWRPMPRADDATSHFYLNDREEHMLRKLLQSAKSESGLRGLEVLGWFRSRTKGEALLDEADVEFHNKFFSLASQFIVVIKPSHQRPASAAIFVRDGDGTFAVTAPTATLTLEPGKMGVGSGDEAMGQLPQVQIDRTPGRMRLSGPWSRIATGAAAGIFTIALAILLLQWNLKRVQGAQGPAGFGLNVEVEAGEWKAMWDPAAPALKNIGEARLELQGEQIELNRAELNRGFRLVPMEKNEVGDVVISLKAGGIEESTHVIASARKF